MEVVSTSPSPRPLTAGLPAALALEHLSDERLLEQIHAGRRSALGELHRRFAPLLQGLAFRLLRDTSDAEETLQDVFLYAWRRAADYDRQRSSVSSWLVVITRSRCLDRLRRRQRRTNLHTQVEREESSSTITRPEGFSQVLEQERANRLRQAISHLPPAQRQVLEFAYFKGWTQKEVAEKIGVPLGTVKTRTFLAMKKLRQELAGELRHLV